MKTRTISVRVPTELGEALDVCAAKLDLSANDVAKHAIRAAVVEIEKRNYRIEWPPHFITVTGDIPQPPVPAAAPRATAQSAGGKPAEKVLEIVRRHAGGRKGSARSS